MQIIKWEQYKLFIASSEGLLGSLDVGKRPKVHGRVLQKWLGLVEIKEWTTMSE